VRSERLPAAFDNKRANVDADEAGRARHQTDFNNRDVLDVKTVRLKRFATRTRDTFDLQDPRLLKARVTPSNTDDDDDDRWVLHAHEYNAICFTGQK